MKKLILVTLALVSLTANAKTVLYCVDGHRSFKLNTRANGKTPYVGLFRDWEGYRPQVLDCVKGHINDFECGVKGGFVAKIFRFSNDNIHVQLYDSADTWSDWGPYIYDLKCGQ